MTHRDVATRIHDMLEAIATISDIQHETGVPPAIARFALERAFEIISEASRHIPDDLKTTESQIAWKQIAGIGNVLRHDYQTVNQKTLHMTASRDVPGLEEALKRILVRIT